MDKKISNATMSRYPVYLKALRKMQHEGKVIREGSNRKGKWILIS